MRILVLGGTHFIGRTIADTLCERHEVSVLNRGSRPHWNHRIEHLVGDRTQVDSLRALNGPAWDVLIDVSATHPTQIDPVLEALHRKPAYYVMLSSAAVYERGIRSGPFRETDHAGGDPLWGDYGISKAACERRLRDAQLPEFSVLRPPYVYGPQNNEEREAWLWARILNGAPVFVPTDTSARIQFVNVRDLAVVCEKLATGRIPPGIYNVGEGEGIRIDDYVHELGRVAARKVDLRYAVRPTPAREYFPFRDIDLLLDTSKLEAAGARPTTTLSEGLVATLALLKAEEPQRLRYCPNHLEVAWTS